MKFINYTWLDSEEGVFTIFFLCMEIGLVLVLALILPKKQDGLSASKEVYALI